MTVDWSSVQGLLIDLDGVVYNGREPIPGGGEFLTEARTRGLRFLLVTNNSTTSPELVSARLHDMHIDVRPDEILTSAQATAAYVRTHGRPGARVRIVGEAGLHQAFIDEGLEVVGDQEDTVEWVVAGLDRAFDYAKLAAATRAILGGARFVATNADALLPVEGGAVVPGAGTMIAAIQTATAVVPTVIGKPEPGMFEVGLSRLGLARPDQAAMVGDRLDTDIEGGHRAGLRTILVLSGVTIPQQVALAAVPPDAVVTNLLAVSGLFNWH